ncbi:Crp/Fnr family transcriptional regulator [Lentzea sp. NBRC 105346]|uniref:Crp/Fnr family transcriptional regulator n=1 Tax=Lentzea sp. NBRC 105346 TaxID=3032205 RepID=UPI0025570874|nr:Crp/Fnr family transcriptional regulator [Lentzea sp. NBRC 105346]
MNAATPGSFLTHIGADDWKYLVESGVARSCEPNEMLFRHGDPAGHVLLVVDGWVKITINAPSGYEAVLAIRGCGDVLGELAVLDGRARSANVRTLCETRVVLLAADRFLHALEARPRIAIALLSHLAGRLRRSDNRRVEQAAHSATERLAAFLLRLADQQGAVVAEGVEISVRLSQQEIAGAIGASREAVARGLRILREREVVITRRRRLVITAPHVLESMAADVQFDTEEPC